MQKNKDNSDFLKLLLRPNTKLELRAIWPNKKVAASEFVNSPEEVEKFASRYKKANIYMGVAPRLAPRKYAPPRVLWADIDFKTCGESAARCDLLLAEMEPSVVIHSGGGLHLYWIIDGDFPGDPKAALRGLANMVSGGDLVCAEWAHILRVPGTLNHKYMPARTVRIEKFDPKLTYEPWEFLSLINNDVSGSETGLSHRVGYTVPTASPAALSLARQRMADWPPAVEGERGDDHTFKAACMLVRDLGLTEEDAFEAMRPWNARCEPPWSEADLHKKIRSAKKYGKGEVGSEDPAHEFPGVEVETVETVKTAATGDDDEDQPRRAATLKNTVRELQKHQSKLQIYYDELSNRVMTGNPPRAWIDADALETTVKLQRNGFRPSDELVHKAALTLAFRDRRHPIREWLDSLEWDGIPRLDRFFENYFGTDPGEYASAVSKNFMISMCARAYKPGCQVDYMPVLEGLQGVGKSSALRIIGGQWFAEQHESAKNSKAFGETLQGKWLVEISEMQSFNTAQREQIKQIITCVEDRYRPPYGRNAQDFPRQCVFAGTTNRDDWNNDDTGARRFWPIVCHKIDLDALKADRGQLFAEAAVRYKNGETWWEVPNEAQAQQAARYTPPAVAEPIQQYLEERFDEFGLPITEVSIPEILESLAIPASQWKTNERHVAEALKHIGWVRRTVRRGDKTVKRWLRPDHAR
jgi:predicted P-loop ATPase